MDKELVLCPFCGKQVPKEGETIETKQTISPRLGIPVNVEFKMTICSNGHKFILMPDLEKTLKNVSNFEGKVISEEIK
jgi:hypothetical protein